MKKIEVPAHERLDEARWRFEDTVRDNRPLTVAQLETLAVFWATQFREWLPLMGSRKKS